MRMKASASALAGGGSITMSWSQPTPVRRSAMAAARVGVMPSRPRRSSSTTKSLPQPCIFRNCTMAWVYAPTRPGWKGPLPSPPPARGGGTLETLPFDDALGLNAQAFDRQAHRIADLQEDGVRFDALADPGRRAGGDN